MTGTTWVEESGHLYGPVMITNTHSVGVVRDADSYRLAVRELQWTPEVSGLETSQIARFGAGTPGPELERRERAGAALFRNRRSTTDRSRQLQAGQRPARPQGGR